MASAFPGAFPHPCPAVTRTQADVPVVGGIRYRCVGGTFLSRANVKTEISPVGRMRGICRGRGGPGGGASVSGCVSFGHSERRPWPGRSLASCVDVVGGCPSLAVDGAQGAGRGSLAATADGQHQGVLQAGGGGRTPARSPGGWALPNLRRVRGWLFQAGRPHLPPRQASVPWGSGLRGWTRTTPSQLSWIASRQTADAGTRGSVAREPVRHDQRLPRWSHASSGRALLSRKETATGPGVRTWMPQGGRRLQTTGTRSGPSGNNSFGADHGNAFPGSGKRGRRRGVRAQADSGAPGISHIPGSRQPRSLLSLCLRVLRANLQPLHTAGCVVTAAARRRSWCVNAAHAGLALHSQAHT